VGDRCPSCDAPLATDQRYCVSCGERRGKARFSADELAPAAVPETPSVQPARPHRSRAALGANYAAGVATLLIAVGVGVLIGHNQSADASRTSSPSIHVTLNGGAYAGTAAAATTASTTSTPTKQPKTVIVHVSAKVAKAAQQAAAKVLGSGGNLDHNVTQQQGGACNGGAGCQNGKFTGNFFGP
jgi:hypothetical protein